MLQYSATLIGHSFWFQEFSRYIDLLERNLTPEDIQDMAIEDNYFQASTVSRANKMIHALRRRAASLDVDYWDLFPLLDVANQKLVNLLTVMFTDRLFNEFMYEVYRNELLLGDAQLHQFEIEAFFNQKQLENPQISHWTPQTVHRLESAYRSFLREADLLVNQGSYDTVNRALIDTRLITLLRSKGVNQELASLLGR